MNFAFLLVFGFDVYRPWTFVMLMKSVFRKSASFAAVVSVVAFGPYLNAPQITTLFFDRLFFTSFIEVGRVSFASLPNNCIMKRAFIRVALMPARESSFFDLRSFFKAEIYFRAIAPPPETITNLWVL